MILVRIELHSAITGQATLLGAMAITNDGTGTDARRNYDVSLISKDGKRGRSARVEGHPSKALSVWYLLSKAIRALYRDAPEEIDAARKDGDWIKGKVS